MAYNRKERTEIIKDIYSTHDSIGFKPVMGEEKKVFSVPIEYLIFNKENGRISTRVKEWENLNKRALNQDEFEEDFNTLAKFIWESNQAANKKTTQNLIERGQEVAGEITADGVVVGGNRRFRCLMEAKKPAMKCVILEEKAGDDVEKLLLLEKTLQNTVDGIVDYGANEKYLECLQMVKAYGAEKKKDGKWVITDECFKKIKKSNPDRYKTKQSIQKDLRILEMMEDYLEETNNPGCYTLLQDKEDYFIELATGYEAYIKGTDGYTEEGWKPSRQDISTWKTMCHAVTKAGFQGGKNETKQYRKLFKTSPQGRDSFFGNREAFNQLKEDFEREIFPAFYKLKTLEDIQKMEGVDPIAQSKTEEDNFKKKVDGKLVGFFNLADRKLQEKTDEGFVERQILQALSSLKGIKFTNSESWPPHTENFSELLESSNSLRRQTEKIYRELQKLDK